MEEKILRLVIMPFVRISVFLGSFVRKGRRVRKGSVVGRGRIVVVGSTVVLWVGVRG